MRTFVAVPLDEPAHARLERAVAAARKAAGATASAWRFVRPESVHLTLKFLGEVEEAAVAGLADALRRAVEGHAAFEAELRGVGAFPGPGRPQVLWVGVRDGAPALAALAQAIDRELAPLGFPAETRPFSAHLTLARAKDPRHARALSGWIAEHAADDHGRLPVREIVLFRSQLSPGGSVYTPLERLPLV